MKTLLRLSAVLILILALLSALFAAWVTWGFDLDDYREEVAALIARQTGLEVEIAGPVRHHLLRGLHLSLEGLSARHAGEEVLAVERLEASISLFGLLHRELLLRRLELQVGSLAAVRDAEGRLNLLPAPTPTAERPAESGPGGGLAAWVGQVHIDELRLLVERGSYRNLGSGLELELDGLSLGVRPIPVLWRTEMVLDDPSLVMAFSETGELQARSLVMGESRLEGVNVAFDNDHGKIDFSLTSLRLQHGTAGKPGHLHLDAQGKAALILGFDEPPEQLPATPWSAVDRVELQGVELDVAALEVITDQGRLRAQESRLEAASLPLLQDGSHLGELIARPSEGPSPLIAARGGELEIGATRLKDYALTLERGAGGLELVVEKGRLGVDPKRPQGQLRKLSARLDGAVRFGLGLRSGASEPALESLTLESGALQLDELELGKGKPWLRVEQSSLRAEALPLPLDAAQLAGLLGGKASNSKTSGAASPVLAVQGDSLRIGATWLEEYSLTLGQGERDLALVLEKMRLRIDPKQPQGEIRKLAARLDGAARFGVGLQSGEKGVSLQSLRVESAVMQVDELEVGKGNGRMRMEKTLLRGQALPLGTGDHTLAGLLARLSTHPGASLEASGTSLEMKPVRMQDFEFALGGKKGRLTVALERGRLQVEAGGKGELRRLALPISGKARLKLKKGSGGIDTLVADSLDLKSKAGVIALAAGEYRFSGAAMTAKALPLVRKGAAADWSDPARLIPALDGARVNLKVNQLEHRGQKISALALELASRKGTLHLEKLKTQLGATGLSGSGEIHFSGKAPPWRLRLAGERVPLPPLLALFDSDFKAQGTIDLDLDLRGSGLEKGRMGRRVQGRVSISGRDIRVDGIELDGLLGDLEGTRKVGLLEVGAYALAGPAGALLTHGRHYTSLATRSGHQGSSHIVALRSELRFEQGVLHAKEAAFATEKNRLAVKGSIDLRENGPLDLQIATVDSNGCPQYLEELKGTVAKPEVVKAGVLIKGVVTPIASVLKTLTKILPGDGCPEPFYTGSVKAPQGSARPLELLER